MSAAMASSSRRMKHAVATREDVAGGVVRRPTADDGNMPGAHPLAQCFGGMQPGGCLGSPYTPLRWDSTANPIAPDHLKKLPHGVPMKPASSPFSVGSKRIVVVRQRCCLAIAS